MIVQIVDLMNSDRDKKRFKVMLNDGRSYNFGLKTGSTYLDHHNEDKRRAYWARHLNNPLEKQLILNLIPSPSLFSAVLIWGPYTNIHDNIKHLNHLFKKKI